MERTLTVTLVEDNPGDARLIREMLRSSAASQFRLVEAHSLAEGLQAMSFRDSDVILLDLSLPDSTGYETFRRARPVAGSVPIVVLTGLEDDDLALQCVREGAQDYLPKNRMGDRVLERAILYAVQRKAADVQRQLTAGILQILNRSNNTSSMVADMLRLIKSTLSFEVAAIRLREGDDYPYFAQSGFSDEFLTEDRSLLQLDEHGAVLRDEQGHPRLDCICGAVIRGDANDLLRTVTARGSFWTNHNSAFAEELAGLGAPAPRPRRCQAGFESISLIPIRWGDETIGLLQLADHRPDRLTAELVESLEGVSASIGVALKRRQAESDLANSEERYRRIVETSGDAVITLDDQGRVTFASRRAEEITGWSAEELIGKPAVDRLRPEDREHFQSSWSRRTLADTDEYEAPIHRKDGAAIWVRVTVRPIRDAAGRMMGSLAMMRDVTQQRRAESELAEARSFLDRLVENAPVSIYATDLEGRYRMVNSALARLIGMERADLIGRKPEDLFEGDTALGIREANRKVIEQRRAIQYSESLRIQGTEHLFHSVKYPTADSSGAVNGVGGVSVDLTERANAEHALAKSEARYRGLFENAPIGILHSLPDGRYLRVSPAYAKMLGYSSPDELVSTIQNIGRELYVDSALRDPLVASILEQPGWTSAQADLRRKDGSIITVSLTVRSVEESDGTPAYLEAFAQDITEQRRAEAALRDSESWLRGVFEQAGVGIAHLTLDGQFVRVNRRFLDIVGRVESEVPSLTVDAVTHPDDIEISRERIRRLVYEDGRPFSVEKRYVRKDGTPVWASVSVSMARDAEGAPAYLIALLTDITERKRAEQELNDARAFTSQLLENAPVPVSVVDASGTYTLVNRALARLYSREPSDIVGRPVSEFYPPPQVEEANGQNRDVLENRRVLIVESAFDFGDGKRYFRTVKFPVTDSTGAATGVAGVGLDVTESRKAQEELRASEEKFRSVVEQSNDGFALCDAAGTLIEWNRSMEAFTGLSASEVIGHSVTDVLSRLRITGPDPSSAIAQVQSALGAFLSGYPLVQSPLIESEIERPDGTRRTVESAIFTIHSESGPLGAIAMRDVSDRRRADAALRRYELLSEHARDIVFFVRQDGRISGVNRAALDAYGYTQEEMLNLHVFDLREPGSEQLVSEQISAARLGGIVFEAVHYRKDGSSFPVEVSSRGADLDGEPVVMSIVRDITDRKRLEEQFRQSQKMESVGRLAGGVAHDFNNLLTAITGYANFALEDLPTESQAREDILEVLKAAGRAGKLTQQLLAFSRRQVMQPQVINLNDLVVDMEKMLRRLIGENIDLVSIPDPNLAAILADPGHMEQILVNLAVNARDAMPDGGTLTIETSNVTLDEAYVRRHAGARVGDHVLLVVSDSGSGMTEDVKSHLFEPFYTTKGPGRGTGLGLATVFGIVRQHQGSIWVYSEPGQGTSFKIYFPRADRQAERIRPPVAVEDMPTGHETILLAEDEPAVRELSIRTLQSLGYNVLQASDGVNALEVARKYEGKVDLLLTDVIMPRMGGKDLAVQLTQQRPNVKVLFVSGYTETGIVRSGVLEDSTAFLQKPYTSRSLAFKVRAVLDAPATIPYSDREG